MGGSCAGKGLRYVGLDPASPGRRPADTVAETGEQGWKAIRDPRGTEVCDGCGPAGRAAGYFCEGHRSRWSIRLLSLCRIVDPSAGVRPGCAACEPPAG